MLPLLFSILNKAEASRCGLKRSPCRAAKAQGTARQSPGRRRGAGALCAASAYSRVERAKALQLPQGPCGGLVAPGAVVDGRRRFSCAPSKASLSVSMAHFRTHKGDKDYHEGGKDVKKAHAPFSMYKRKSRKSKRRSVSRRRPASKARRRRSASRCGRR